MEGHASASPTSDLCCSDTLPRPPTQIRTTTTVQGKSQGNRSVLHYVRADGERSPEDSDMTACRAASQRQKAEATRAEWAHLEDG